MHNDLQNMTYTLWFGFELQGKGLFLGYWHTFGF